MIDPQNASSQPSGLRPLSPSGFEIASYGKRLGAFLLDMICLVFLITLLIQYLGLTDFDPTKYPDPQAMQAAFLEKLMGLSGNQKMILALGPYAAFFALHSYFLSQFGQTLGKRVMGIAIVTLDDKKPDFFPLIVQRYLPQWIVGGLPMLGPLLRLADILFLFNDPQKRCIHDRLAKTKVVDLSRPISLASSAGPRQATLEV